MKLEQQVCSLKLAQKLKGLGVKQESLFAWNMFGGIEEKPVWMLRATPYEYRLAMDRRCSAFTVAELGEVLPSYNWFYPYSFKMSSQKEWSCVWISAKDGRIEHQVVADTEADARAKMLIYLLENGLITL